MKFYESATISFKVNRRDGQKLRIIATLLNKTIGDYIREIVKLELDKYEKDHPTQMKAVYEVFFKDEEKSPYQIKG